MSESCEGGALVADGFWVKGEGGDMVVNPDVHPFARHEPLPERHSA